MAQVNLNPTARTSPLRTGIRGLVVLPLRSGESDIQYLHELDEQHGRVQVSLHGGAWTPQRRGFGFAIDYDKSIADDDLMISNAQRAIQHGWYRRSIACKNGAMFEVIELWQLVMYFRDVADAAGYSAQDISDLAGYLEQDIWSMHPDLPDHRTNREGYLRGKQIAEQLTGEYAVWLYRDETDARKGLRNAKASRARHVRNKEKFGRSR